MSPLRDDNKTKSRSEALPEVEKSISNSSKTVGPSTNEEESATSQQSERNTNTKLSMEPDIETKTSELAESAKEQGDDGGEMVEGEEDTVIY